MRIGRGSRMVFGIAAILVAGLLEAVVVASPAMAAAGAIRSGGPLSEVSISSDLNCRVQHVNFAHSAFFGDTACATLAVIDGELFGPADIPAGSSAAPRTTFTAVSQTPVTGNGTSNSPFALTTVVDLGSTGIRLTETDRYVTGSEAYDTQITFQNSSSGAKSARLYRAGDCYLADSDIGYGAKGSAWTACVDSAKQRILQLTDLSGGARTYEAGYSSVWSVIGQQAAFDDSCQCDIQIDNGVGLSWDVSIPGGGQRTTISRVAFTPNAGTDDRDGDGLKDAWETSGYDFGGEHVPLDQWGADPNRKDVFLQVSWMSTHWYIDCNWLNFWTGCASKSKDFAPNRDRLDELRKTFAENGINLHIDAGPRSPPNTDGRAFPLPLGGMSIQYRESFADSSSEKDKAAALSAAHDSALSDARKKSFHLVVIGDHPWGTDDTTGFSYTPGAISFISGGAVSSDEQLELTIMHEFGHSLGLNHGGPKQRDGSDLNCKPNYKSVMNYLFQLRGLGMKYESSSSLGNSAPLLSEIQSCINSGGSPYPEAPYSVYADWPELEYRGGGIGGLSAGSLADPVIADEPEYADLLENGLAAENGDGGVDVVAPTVLFEGIAGQSLTVRVTNPGNVSSSYDLAVGLGNAAQSTQPVTVASHSSLDVQIPVPAAVGPALAVTASVSAPGSSSPLSTKDATLPVLQFDRAAAQAALDASSTDGASVPVDVRVALTQALARLTASPPASIEVVTGNNQAVAVSKPFPAALVAKALDQSGRPVVGAPMRFEVTSGSASFGGSSSKEVVTGADGIATAPQLIAGKSGGPVVITASTGSATVQFLESVIAAGNGKTDLKLSLSAPATARVGETVSVRVAVTNSGRAQRPVSQRLQRSQTGSRSSTPVGERSGAH